MERNNWVRKGSATCKNHDLTLVAAVGNDGERVDPSNISLSPIESISLRDLKRLKKNQPWNKNNRLALSVASLENHCRN